MIARAAEPRPLTTEDELHWLALRLVPGLGARTAGRLVERFRSPQAIFRASRTELEASGVSGDVAQSIASGCSFDEAVSQQQKAREGGAAIVPMVHPSYPATLRGAYDPPVVLFARGRVELLSSLLIAIVGTRRPTPYGVSVAERLGADLASAGVGVISGMARGVDTAAHRGALSVQGDTVAVLGCGVDVVYPSENKKLASELSTRGLLISEFPMGAVAFPQNFPIRNRIIAAVSAGVVVVEGAQYSGSAITARLALDQGRDVFAVPGNITSKMSWGPNLLIKQGAKLVQDFNDILEELPLEARRRLAEHRAAPQQLGLGEPAVAGLARWALDQLKVEAATHIDGLIESLEQASPSELIACLFELEMQGLVRQLPGRNFVKVW